MINILRLQDTLKDLSDKQLAGEMANPSGSSPQYLVLSELKRRERMRMEAGAGPTPTTTMAEEAMAKAKQPPQSANSVMPAMGLRGLPAANDFYQEDPTINAQGPTANFEGGGKVPSSGLARYVEEMRAVQAEDKLKPYLEEAAMRREKAEGRRGENGWLALARAGFGMAAGNSPNAMQNIGAGGVQGLESFNELEQRRRRDVSEADQRAFGLAALAQKRQDDMVGAASQREMADRQIGASAGQAAAARAQADAHFAANMGFQREQEGARNKYNADKLAADIMSTEEVKATRELQAIRQYMTGLEGQEAKYRAMKIEAYDPAEKAQIDTKLRQIEQERALLMPRLRAAAKIEGLQAPAAAAGPTGPVPVQTPEEAARLPKGTRIVLPNGEERVTR